MSTRRVVILRDTVAGGRPVAVGEVVDLPAGDAVELFRLRKARAYDAPTEPAVAVEVEATHADPAPARKRGR